MPGWAWLVLGLLIGIGVILMAPSLLRSDGEDGFFRPRPNPDAQPAAGTGAEEAIVPEATTRDAPRGAATAPDEEARPEYDFYTMLPGDEVAITDEELAETAAAEQAQARAAATPPRDDAADLREPEATPAPAAAAPPAATDDGARYLLQAGSFSASGDAESLKARIALLGLSARVESAQVKDKTVYRVRMGPYGSASELADAKRKLESGGLPALAIRVE
jgi:cell division protein FtsN